MADKIFLSSPDVTQLEEDALVRAFRSGWIAPLGPEVNAFEAELAEYCGRKYAVALSSGTAAIHLGLLHLGIGSGDIVLTSTMTFAATANAITYTGAIPVFLDCDDTGNMNPEHLKRAFDVLTSEGKEVKAVVPVDLLGKIADHESIVDVCSKFDVPVLSDAAESLGAVRNGKAAPSFGVAAAVSFNGNKIMTTSGGGALLTDDEEFAENVRYLATQARQPVVHYEHTDIGYNYRMSNLLAAMGRAQLSRLNLMLEKRRENRKFYQELFKEVPGTRIFGEPSAIEEAQTQDNFWLTSVLVDASEAGFAAEDLRLALLQNNIEARPLWKPMHLQPIYRHHRAFVDGCSESLFRTGISLPSGSALSAVERSRIEQTIKQFLEYHNER